MKKISLVCALLFIASCSISKAPNPQIYQDGPMQFVEGSQDIPLAKGLEKIQEDGLGFDSVGGSIVSVSYKNNNESREIKDFYLSTLPQMGWKIAKSDNLISLDTVDFVRDEERLEIEFVSENNMSLVRFFIESSSE